MWIVIFFLVGAAWYAVAVFLGDGSQGNCPLDATPIQEKMKVDFEKIVYTGFRYTVATNKGYDLCLNGILYSFVLLKIVFISGAIVLYCGIRTYREMARKRASTSRKTHDMQKQLFKALVVQTIIPSLLLYIPLITMFVAPIFQWDLDNIDALLLFSFVFYPILDPIAVLYLIGDYKKAIKTMIEEYITQNLVKLVTKLSQPRPTPQPMNIVHIPRIIPSSILY